MNRAVNIFSILILMLYFSMVSAVIYDFSMSSFTLQGMPYKVEIFSSISFLFLLLGLIRVKRRWQGIRDMNKYKRFVFSKQITKTAIKFASFFSMVEIIVLCLGLWFASSLYELNQNYVLPMILALCVLILESIIFFIKIKSNGNGFRYGMDDKVVAFFLREMHLYYYTGLLRVELYQKDIINFMYRDDLNLTLPTNIIEKEDRIEFRDNLIKILEAKNVYIDDAFRKWE